MGGRRRLSAFLAGGALAFGLGGCTVVDEFSGRAVQYNLEAEQAQDQDLLLNIVRASERRPLEFTGVQSVSGTASASGSGTLTFPFGHRPRPSPNSLALTEGVSGGPTFAVAVLDTQDFFEGILAPIPLQSVDFYLKEGYPPPLVFDLFVGTVILSQTAGNATHRVEIRNAVDSDPSALRFQLVASYLLNLGLATEPQAQSTSYGPLLTGAEASEIGMLARAATAGLDVKQVGWCDLSPADRQATVARLGVVAGNTVAAVAATVNSDCAAHNTVPQAVLNQIAHAPPVLYRVQKAAAGFQLCFEEREAPAAAAQGQSVTAAKAATLAQARQAIAGSSVACGAKPKSAGAASPDLQRTEVQNQSSGFSGIPLGEELGQYLNALETRLSQQNAGAIETAFPPDVTGLAPVYKGIDFSHPVAVQLVPRSTEGVIYYLGEIVRRHLKPEFAEKRLVTFPYGKASEPIPYTLCLGPTRKPAASSAASAQASYNCEPLLRVDASAEGGAGALSVAYNDEHFTVPGEPARAGTSFQVLDLVTQLIALNKSAKSLPATSVFTIISPP